ncbi:cell wall assembly protein [Brenneria roseae subsp. americana]|uniref:Cell wall assembly protein n=1 Tax=Brenneria roseae subsp. americana TaxID=1508507 RepID=A0A2U1TKH2_9GAMM|nr:SMI1/KNR4 family protein [Brenneria roseae]PWC09900.1 cell wall assembly protein [Brenneria roseae subsp. americana]
MSIVKEDLVNWHMDETLFEQDPVNIEKKVKNVESVLNVNLPSEFKIFLLLTNDQAISPVEDKDFCLAKYNNESRVVYVDGFYSCESIIEITKLSQESIYEHRFILPEGLIVIGVNYDGATDAHIVYDVRPGSPTYQHLFNWRYSVDNVFVGEGLGFLAHSLKEFLNTPTSEDEL